MARLSYPALAGKFVAASSQHGVIADANQVGLDPGTGDFSLELWLRCDSLAALRTFVGKGSVANTLSDAQGYWFFVQTDGSLRVIYGVTGSATRTDRATAAGAVTAGVWAHLVFNWDRDSTPTVYKNGALQSTLASIVATVGGDINSPGSFRLGAATTPASDAASSYFEGLMDCVRWRNRLMTVTEITRSYNNGVGLAARDLSASERVSLTGAWDLDGNLRDGQNGNHLTNVNGVSFAPGKR